MNTLENLIQQCRSKEITVSDFAKAIRPLFPVEFGIDIDHGLGDLAEGYLTDKDFIDSIEENAHLTNRTD